MRGAELAHLLEGGGVGVDLGPGPAFGDGDQQAAAVGARHVGRADRYPRQEARLGHPLDQGHGVDGRADGELAQRGTGRHRDDPVDGQDGLARVAGAPGALQRQLPQPGGAEPAELDREAHGDEGLVGAHVGGRLLPADVLLAGAERGDVRGAALGVHRLTDQAAREPPDELLAAGEQADIGTAEGQRGPEHLPLADNDIGAELAR